MRVDVLAWLAAAVLLMAGGLLGLTVMRSDRRWPFLIFTAAGLLGILVGTGWRTWQARAWPVVSVADTLAMLAGGALVVTAWTVLRPTPAAAAEERPTAPALALLGTACLVAAAAGVAWRGTAPVASQQPQSWLVGLRDVLASVGLGGWLPTLAASALWSVRAGLLNSRAAADPGRVPALFSYPWLTAAGLVGVLWNLASHVTVLQATAADLWLLAAWLLGGIYLHATSNWRPLRLPAWLSLALAGITMATALLAAVTAPTLL
jgi:hypothetical protein